MPWNVKHIYVHMYENDLTLSVENALIASEYPQLVMEVSEPDKQLMSWFVIPLYYDPVT